MAAVEPGAPARPVVAPRPRRAPKPRTDLPYLNRELSWLKFNMRVLHEAQDERNAPLERAKFLAIFAGNLDEFFQVRIAGLRQQVEAGAVARAADGRTPSRSTDSGVTRPGPANPWTADTTVRAPATAGPSEEGSRTSPRATSTSGPSQRRRAGDVTGQHPDPFAAGRQPGDDKRAESAGPAGHENHGRPRSCAATAESIEPPPCWTGSR